MVAPITIKRLVYHIGGYDPFGPPEVAYLRFKREVGRFESAWSVTSDVSPAQFTSDEARWLIRTEGPNWRVETDYRLFRWDDIIAKRALQSPWKRLSRGMFAFLEFVVCGAL